MKIQTVELSEVRPYDRNPRKNERGVAKVAASIREFGFRQPIVVDPEMVIIAGHTRYLAAAHLGLDKVPVHVARGLSAEQLKAYRIADNRTAEESEWDEERLRAEMAELGAVESFDMDLTGFDQHELRRLLAENAGSADNQDDLPDDDQVDAVASAGDIWELGSHRLMCGDSTDLDSVTTLMDGKRAELFSTDPPYVVMYTGNDRPEGVGKDWSDKYHETDITDARAFFSGVFSAAAAVAVDHAAWYCWHAHKRAPIIEEVWTELGVINHQQIIWVKPIAPPSFSYYKYQHEPCLMGWKTGHKPPHNGSNGMEEDTSVWHVDWEGVSRPIGNDHPTQKPVEIFARPMRKHTVPGDICYEPFSGSGSQIIAGEQNNRRVFAMEIEPHFVDVAVKRWELFTGGKATRVSG